MRLPLSDASDGTDPTMLPASRRNISTPRNVTISQSIDAMLLRRPLRAPGVLPLNFNACANRISTGHLLIFLPRKHVFQG